MRRPIVQGGGRRFGGATSQDDEASDLREGRSSIPLATYRLQFNAQFTFAQATALVDYLRELGVSDVYASPLFQARPGSTHGYDVCGFDQLGAALGGNSGFERLSNKLKQCGMGLVLDMVPNHMGADLANEWWLDVLRNGPGSKYARCFDINWDNGDDDAPGKVLLPVLEDHYAKVLEAGKLKVELQNDQAWLSYYERRLPLSPESQRTLLSSAAFRKNPSQFLAELNGFAGKPESFNRLDDLLRRQHYRLAWWRIAPEEINYRRFFDISDLISLRMEDPKVFAATHRAVFQLLREGRVTGLRIDHPDGLRDPKRYFERLQAGAPGKRSASASKSGQGLFVVAEKILTRDENLPRDWPLAGTTGYDFLNQVNGLFVNQANEWAFDGLYAEFTGQHQHFETLVAACKRQVLEQSFSGDLSRLVERAKRIAAASRLGQDLTFSQLHACLTEIVAQFPVYRTYVDERTNDLRPEERIYVEQALSRARESNAELDSVALDFFQRLLLLEPWPELDDEARKLAREWVMRFQQFTSPVMAKGLEDTAFYNYNRLISLNEVGGSPERFGISIEKFNDCCRKRAKDFPHSLLATATHDTKRGEDARARIDVLSELPNEWRTAIKRWSRLNAEHKTMIGGEPAPAPNDEYLLYQTLIGAWPFEAEASAAGLREFEKRIEAYLLKAVREAKAHTSWTQPNADYENAITRFVRSLLSRSKSARFLGDFAAFQERISFFAKFNSLAQTLIKLTAPGVPDIYQGSELWDFSLVDPDNRRPVDYEKRRELLKELRRDCAGAKDSERESSKLLEEMLKPKGMAEKSKLFVIWKTLAARRARRELFEEGEYVALTVSGVKKEHVCAFARSWNGQIVISVVPRLVATLMNGRERVPLGEAVWGNTRVSLPTSQRAQRFRDVFTGRILAAEKGTLRLSDIFGHFPVALLESEAVR